MSQSLERASQDKKAVNVDEMGTLAAHLVRIIDKFGDECKLWTSITLLDRLEAFLDECVL